MSQTASCDVTEDVWLSQSHLIEGGCVWAQVTEEDRSGLLGLLWSSVVVWKLWGVFGLIMLLHKDQTRGWSIWCLMSCLWTMEWCFFLVLDILKFTHSFKDSTFHSNCYTDIIIFNQKMSCIWNKCNKTSNGLRLLNLTVYSLNPKGFNHFEMIKDTYSIKVYFFITIKITDWGQNFCFKIHFKVIISIQ